MMALLAAAFAALAVFVGAASLSGRETERRRILARVSLADSPTAQSRRQRAGAGSLLRRAARARFNVRERSARLSWADRRLQLFERAALPLRINEYLVLVTVVFAVLALIAAV